VTFRRANDVALRRIGGPVTITPPGGDAYECRGLFRRTYDDDHLSQGGQVECWERGGTFIGRFILQNAQPDDAGMMRITLRAAKP